MNVLGDAVARWIEERLVHGEGDYLGEPFRLEKWQRNEIIRPLYRCDAKGERIVRRALIVLPKGCGKTELCAAIALNELAGPARLVKVGGKWMPRLRKSPNIPIGAASYEQADRLYGAARIMGSHDNSAVAPYVEPYEHKMLLRDRPGRMFRVAAEAGTAEGGLPTCFIADEVHEWTGRKRRVHLVIGNSLAKRRGGLELNITTPDDADPTSLLGEMISYARQVQSGEIRDPSFLFVWHHASDPWDLGDPKDLRRGLAEATPAGWLDIEQIAKRYEVDHIPDHEFRRYHGAQFVRPDTSYIPAGAWETLPIRREPPEPGSEIVCFFDGSYTHDSSAIVACTPEGNLHVLGHWERKDETSKWVVPTQRVHDKVDEIMATYNVRIFATDPFRWKTETQGWAATYGSPPVIEFPTNQPARMIPACGAFYAAVVNQTITWDGNPALARHLANAVVRRRGDGIMITKESPTSPRRIDLAICAIGAQYLAVTQHDESADEIEPSVMLL